MRCDVKEDADDRDGEVDGSEGDVGGESFSRRATDTLSGATPVQLAAGCGWRRLPLLSWAVVVVVHEEELRQGESGGWESGGKTTVKHNRLRCCTRANLRRGSEAASSRSGAADAARKTTTMTTTMLPMVMRAMRRGTPNGDGEKREGATALRERRHRVSAVQALTLTFAIAMAAMLVAMAAAMMAISPMTRRRLTTTKRRVSPPDVVEGVKVEVVVLAACVA